MPHFVVLIFVICGKHYTYMLLKRLNAELPESMITAALVPQLVKNETCYFLPASCSLRPPEWWLTDAAEWLTSAPTSALCVRPPREWEGGRRWKITQHKQKLTQLFMTMSDFYPLILVHQLTSVSCFFFVVYCNLCLEPSEGVRMQISSKPTLVQCINIYDNIIHGSVFSYNLKWL